MDDNKTRKPRKTYTEDEKAKILESMQTRGRKGVKLPRLNISYSPENYEYVHIMARVQGKTLTQFVNEIIEQHRKENSALFEKARDFRKQL